MLWIHHLLHIKQKTTLSAKLVKGKLATFCLHQAHLNGSRFGMTFQEMLGFDLTLSVLLCWVLWGHWFGTSLSFWLQPFCVFLRASVSLCSWLVWLPWSQEKIIREIATNLELLIRLTKELLSYSTFPRSPIRFQTVLRSWLTFHSIFYYVPIPLPLPNSWEIWGLCLCPQSVLLCHHHCPMRGQWAVLVLSFENQEGKSYSHVSSSFLQSQSHAMRTQDAQYVFPEKINPCHQRWSLLLLTLSCFAFLPLS